MDRKQASTFDPALFDQVTQIIAEQLGGNQDTPDLEAHILGEAGQSEEDKNLLNAQFCHEFRTLPLYPLYVQSLTKMVEREHQRFEVAETDPEDKLRINWHAYQRVVTEILSHIESASNTYLDSLKVADGIQEDSV